MNIIDRAIESAQVRYDRAKYYYDTSNGDEKTKNKKLKQLEVATYVLSLLLQEKRNNTRKES